MNELFNIVNSHNVAVINDICTAQIVTMTCENAEARATEKKKKGALKKILRAIIPVWSVESPTHVAMTAIMLIAAISAIVLVSMNFANLIRFGYVPELYDVWMPVFFTALASTAMLAGRSDLK